MPRLVRWFCGSVAALMVVSCTPTREVAGPVGPPRAALVDGLGVYGRSTSTASPVAQRFFDQGLNFVFGYYFVHAVASFQEALRHDPDHAMSYWGLALAIGPNPNSRYARLPDDPQREGRRAIETAMQLRESATPLERGLIEALHVRYDDATYPERDARDRAYIDAARDLYERHPSDPDTGFLYADALMTASHWNYWDSAGHPRPGTTDAAAALEHVMRLDPFHPGANHLYIHLFEASRTPGRALPQAARLAETMPNVGHIVHMPSHIYIRVGEYAKAIDTNLRSLEADRVLLEAWGDRPFPEICSFNVSARVHGTHAMDFIRLAATFQGNYGTAIEHARRLAASAPVKAMPQRNQRAVAAVWVVHKTFGRWDELDKEAAPSSQYPYLQGMWRYVQGSKHTRRGDLAAAERALAELREFQTHPDIQRFPIQANPGAKVLEIAAHGLAGEIALARGELDAAIEAFRTGVALEDGLGYMEPPDWAQPMRLSLGRTYLQAWQPELAEAVFRQALERFPENGWALYGLSQSLVAQNRGDESTAVQQRFEQAWRFADTALTASLF